MRFAALNQVMRLFLSMGDILREAEGGGGADGKMQIQLTLIALHYAKMHNG